MLNKLDKFLKVYKFIFFIIYLILTVFFTYVLIDDINIKNDPSQSLAGLGFGLIVVAIGSITYGIVSFINLIIMIISILNKDSIYRKKNIILSFCMFILPILTELILILVGLMFF